MVKDREHYFNSASGFVKNEGDDTFVMIHPDHPHGDGDQVYIVVESTERVHTMHKDDATSWVEERGGRIYRAVDEEGNSVTYLSTDQLREKGWID